MSLWIYRRYINIYLLGEPFTDNSNMIKHILLESKLLNNTRKHYFHTNTIKDLFENVHMDDVLSFLKETGFYQKIWTWLQSWKHNKQSTESELLLNRNTIMFVLEIEARSNKKAIIIK